MNEYSWSTRQRYMEIKKPSNTPRNNQSDGVEVSRRRDSAFTHHPSMLIVELANAKRFDTKNWVYVILFGVELGL